LFTVDADTYVKYIHRLYVGSVAEISEVYVSPILKVEGNIFPHFFFCTGASTLLLLVLVLARLVLVGRLVWLLLVLVNLRPHYSCSPGLGA
jgi:hypothetical protein